VHRAFGWKFWSFVVGAAPLDPALEEFWQRLGYVVIQGYGLTETAPIVSLNHPFRTSRGSVGKAIAGVEMKIAADGEILVRGENVTSGYCGAAAATAEAFEDGWFHTGDIGELDGEGRLFIKGRKKEMIVTPEGLNVFLEDVERVVAHQPGCVMSQSWIAHRRGRARPRRRRPDPGTDPRPSSAQTSRSPIIKKSAELLWESGELPRTEGTRKLKRREIHDWVATGPLLNAPLRTRRRWRTWSRSSPAGARSSRA
jgi:long-chain acyl-CoA synthetase